MGHPAGPGMVPGTIRVLLLIKGLGVGGAERLLVSTAKALDCSTFVPEVAYMLPWKDALVPELEAHGVAVHCLHGGDWRDPRWLGRLRRLVVRGRYDVVHAHLPVMASAARLVCRSLGTSRPVVVTTEHNAWSSYSVPTRVVNALTAVFDECTVAVSEEVRDSIWWSSVRRRTTVVVHGVAVDEIAAQLAFRQASRAEVGATADDVVVATVANYRAQKAYPDLLAAARRVLDAGLPARFVAVGQGPLEDDVRACHASLRLGERFLLLGFRPDAARVLAGADVFVLASHYEGYPVALMEAMALGLPVVGTAVGGVREAVTSGVEGLLVPPGRPDQLAEALRALIADAASRARMGRASWRRGREFDIARSVRRIEHIYRSALRHRTGRAAKTGHHGRE